MSTSHRAAPAPGRPAASGSSGSRPNLMATWGRFGIGTFCGGLVAVIAAVIIHDHAAYPNSLCNTGLGELGQAFSNTVQTDCGVAGIAESTVGWLVFFGVAGIVIGLAKMGLGLAGALPAPAQASALKRSAAMGGQGSASGTTAVATPAANQAPYGSAPTPPPAQAPYGYGPTRTGSTVPERPAAWAPPPPVPPSSAPSAPPSSGRHASVPPWVARPSVAPPPPEPSSPVGPARPPWPES